MKPGNHSEFGASKVFLMFVAVAVSLGAVVLSQLRGSHFHWQGAQGGTCEFTIGQGGGSSAAVLIPLLMGFALGCVFGFPAKWRGLSLKGLAGESDSDGATVESSEADSASATPGGWLRRIRKSGADKKWSGVCGGLGEFTPVPSWIWRVLFVLLAFCDGLGVLVYVVLAFAMPEQEKPVRSSRW